MNQSHQDFTDFCFGDFSEKLQVKSYFGIERFHAIRGETHKLITESL